MRCCTRMPCVQPLVIWWVSVALRPFAQPLGKETASG